MDNKEYILDVKKLNTTFISDRKEIKIVKDVSFKVRRAKTLAVVGESGCGKSVTMNSIMRFTGKNAIVKAENIQYNALRDGQVTAVSYTHLKDPLSGSGGESIADRRMGDCCRRSDYPSAGNRTAFYESN